jgi:WD40 repeat protein
VKSDCFHLPNGRFISKDGSRIALVGRWGGYEYWRIDAWSLEHDQPKIFSRDYWGPLKACGFLPNGTQIAIAIGSKKLTYSDAETVLVVDIDAENITHTLHDAGDVTCVAFPPCGKVIAFGSNSKVCLWHLETDQVEIILQTVGCRLIALSPDKLKLALAMKTGIVKLYNLSQLPSFMVTSRLLAASPSGLSSLPAVRPLLLDRNLTETR